MNPTRVTSTAGAAAVAGIAAWSSWSHMVGVALHVGERPEVAYLLPLSVDGLLIVASAAMVDDKRSGRAPRWSARVAFAVGVLASLTANVAHAQPTWGARAVAAWPALALLLVVELLSRRGRAVAHTGQASAEPVTVSGRPEWLPPVVPVSPAPMMGRTATSPLTGKPLGGPRTAPSGP